MVSIGIIGLPNVGKSTLFNALTKSEAFAANFPFATIDPNIRIIDVPDERLNSLAKIYNSEKIIYANIEVIDIAGLVKGASKGEGLGNKFLSNIREVDAIAHVVRLFDDDNITHVEGKLNPLRDIEIINLELIFSDLDIVDSRMKRLKKLTQMNNKEAVIEYNALNKIREELINGRFASNSDLDDIEINSIKHYNLLTFKSMIYICNLKEEQLNNFYDDKKNKELIDYANKNNCKIIPVCAELESEICQFDKNDREEYLKKINVNSSIDGMIKEFYKTLDLESFFTVGPKEARAWKFKKHTKAPDAAAIIHTDFKKGFIKAEVINFKEIKNMKEIAMMKKKIRIEGKNYELKDGDIVHFRYNI